MKIAIHDRKNSFSKKWIEYCIENKIEYKIVDCFNTNIIGDIQGYDALLWHWPHHDYKAQLFARQLIISIEKMNIKVFPNSDTCWHYDDKVGQKYLLEAIGAPFIRSYVFYEKNDALEWIKNTTFPMVFKLRGGAGSQNVKLVDSQSQAKKIIKKAFNEGFPLEDKMYTFYEKVLTFKREKTIKNFFGILKGLEKAIKPNKKIKNFPRQIAYVYFQDFIPQNDHDIRIIIIGNRGFGIKRYVRENDFRASGSGRIDYDPKIIPRECLKIAFDVSQKLNAQSLAYDFVFLDGKPLIVEISYAFARKGYLECKGYWDRDLNWHGGDFIPEYFMIEDMINVCQ